MYSAVGQDHSQLKHLDQSSCTQMAKDLPSRGGIWAPGDGCYVQPPSDPVVAATFPTLCLAYSGHWDPAKAMCFFPAVDPNNPPVPPSVTMGPFLDEAGCNAMTAELPSSGGKWTDGEGCYISPASGPVAAAFPTLCMSRRGKWDDSQKVCFFQRPPSPPSETNRWVVPLAAGGALAIGAWFLLRKKK